VAGLGRPLSRVPLSTLPPWRTQQANLNHSPFKTLNSQLQRHTPYTLEHIAPSLRLHSQLSTRLLCTFKNTLGHARTHYDDFAPHFQTWPSFAALAFQSPPASLQLSTRLLCTFKTHCDTLKHIAAFFCVARRIRWRPPRFNPILSRLTTLNSKLAKHTRTHSVFRTLRSSAFSCAIPILQSALSTLHSPGTSHPHPAPNPGLLPRFVPPLIRSL
jgi:hypothetical protein